MYLKFGEIFINKGDLEIGKGLNKIKKCNSNVSIKGIVSNDYKDNIKNFFELKNVSFDIIERLAYMASEKIRKILG